MTQREEKPVPEDLSQPGTILRRKWFRGDKLSGKVDLQAVTQDVKDGKETCDSEEEQPRMNPPHEETQERYRLEIHHKVD